MLQTSVFWTVCFVIKSLQKILQKIFCAKVFPVKVFLPLFGKFPAQNFWHLNHNLIMHVKFGMSALSTLLTLFCKSHGKQLSELRILLVILQKRDPLGEHFCISDPHFTSKQTLKILFAILLACKSKCGGHTAP